MKLGKMLKEVAYKIDVNTLNRVPEDVKFGKSDICSLRLRNTKPLLTDADWENITTGSFILIDKDTNETDGAGM